MSNKCTMLTERAYVWVFFDNIESENRQAQIKRNMSVNGFRYTEKRSNVKRLAFFADCRIDKRARGEAAKSDKTLIADFRKAAKTVAGTFKMKAASTRKTLNAFQPRKAKATTKAAKQRKAKAAKPSKAAKSSKKEILDKVSELLAQLVE